MDEEISIINSTTRNEKIINFFIKNKKKLIFLASIILVLAVSYFAYVDFLTKEKNNLSNKYNKSSLNFSIENKTEVKKEMIEIVYKKDETYSPLALYFIIDNNIVTTQKEINELFDEILKIRKLDKEIKNLIIYKKGLLNSDFKNENDLIKILSPVLNSNSIWKSHALFLMGEYFLGKNEKQKAKEFLEKILILENSNPNIKLETQRLIQRELGE
jgi:predicted negative regulator of RcsB-dependent stress response